MKVADFLGQAFVFGGYASLQLGQHSFDGGRDCRLDGPLKQRGHLHHNRLDDVMDGNTGRRDGGAHLQ